MSNLRQDFIEFSVKTGVLRFGEFTTKAGRQSPYFFNAGLFHDGATLAQLAQFYAQTLLDSGVEFDMLSFWHGGKCLKKRRNFGMR